MLLYNMNCLWTVLLLYMFIAVACAGCAYCVDARRSPDDPQKRNSHPIGIVLAPIMLPLCILSKILSFILTVLLGGVLLILFPIALIAVRESFLLRWIRKIATTIGNSMLDTSTILVGQSVEPEVNQPGTKKAPYKAGALAGRFI